MTDPLASDMVAATLPVGPVEEDVDPAEEDIVPVERDVDPVEEDVGPMEKDVVPIEGSVPPAKEDAEKEGSDYDRPSSQTQKRRRRPRCYNCRKHGHLSANCTRPRRRPAKKNAKTKLPKVFGRARQCSDPCRLDIDETQETNADAFQKKVIESSPATSKSEPSQVADAPQANSDAQTATGLNEKDIDAINALVKETLTLTLQRMEQVNVQAINDCLAEAKAFTMERTNDIETSFRLTQSSVDVILHKVRGIVNNSVEEAVKRVLDTRLGNGVEVILDRVRGVINHSVKEAVHGVLESRTGDGEPIQECRNLEAAITDDPRRAHCRRHSAPIDRSRRKSEN